MRSIPRLGTLLGISSLCLVPWLMASNRESGLELLISPAEGGMPLARLPLDTGEIFTLSYVHSVELTPVREGMSVDADGTIFVESEWFESFGAGHGHWPGHGEISTRGSFLAIDGIHKRLGSFVLRIGEPPVNHAIETRGRRLMLSELSPAGTAVKISARPHSRFGLPRWFR